MLKFLNLDLYLTVLTPFREPPDGIVEQGVMLEIKCPYRRKIRRSYTRPILLSNSRSIRYLWIRRM